MRVLFATAELAPFAKVGGLADASAGLVKALRQRGLSVEVVLPDYGDLAVGNWSEERLSVPGWAGPAMARRGSLDGFVSVVLVETPGIKRPHPYVDRDGSGWPDNDHRFFAFSAAVAALIKGTQPDVVHLNDWHTSPVLGFLPSAPPTVLTIHNLAYQGHASGRWLQRLPHRPEEYERRDGVNPLAGAIALADRVVAVSPTYATEVLQPEAGFGLHEVLAAKETDFLGILNGIETDVWDPATDPHLPLHYGVATAFRKREIGRRLARELGWDPSDEPLIGMVTRLTDQKGVDIALEAAPALPELGARMVMLGSGERSLADAARTVESRLRGRFSFRDGYDEGLSHRIFGASDLYLMPSRFEPAGLTQMQAMRYGAIPVVTDVGGLHDTVIDDDHEVGEGNGFVAPEPTEASVGETMARALLAWRSTRRRGGLRKRGMLRDWSWREPAARYADLYEEITSVR